MVMGLAMSSKIEKMARLCNACALFAMLGATGCAGGSGTLQAPPAGVAVFTLTPSSSSLAINGTAQLTLGGPSATSGEVAGYDSTCITVSPSSVPVGGTFTVTAKGVACQTTITVDGENVPSAYGSTSNAVATITVQ